MSYWTIEIAKRREGEGGEKERKKENKDEPRDRCCRGRGSSPRADRLDPLGQLLDCKPPMLDERKREAKGQVAFLSSKEGSC